MVPAPLGASPPVRTTAPSPRSPSTQGGARFQIADDLLDVTATTEQLGKTAGRDLTLAKATYVSMLGVDGARREAVRHADLACAALGPVEPAGAALRTLAGYIVERRS